MNKCLSIITTNVNGLNVSIKIHRVAECIRKYMHIYYQQETHLRKKTSTQTERGGLEKIFQANGEKQLRYQYLYQIK